MKAEILKRIVRAIADGSQEDLDRLAQRMVEAERTLGHVRLAGELEAVLRQSSRPRNGRAPTNGSRALQELPQSKRYGQALATLFPRESLEHHMVLPALVEEKFARIECEYAARERLASFGLHHRRTVLLYGPPGCGKSLGAKRLAWNTGLPLLKVRFDVLISSYFGESAANLRAVFDTARDRPCVLLFDEYDFIGRARGGSKDVGEAARIVNTLLQLMEDYDGPGLLVATTNVGDTLDSALFRRFDDAFLVPPPGPEEADRLLKTTLSAIEVSSRIAWKKIVGELAGLSAAQVVKCAMDAAKSVVLQGETVVHERHLRMAIADVKLDPRDELRP